MSDQAKPYRSPLWPPPGHWGAAHHCKKGERCRCGPSPTTMLLIHAPAEADLTRALCGSGEGWVTGVEFHSPVTCEACREKQGKPRAFLGTGSRVRLLAAVPEPDEGEDEGGVT